MLNNRVNELSIKMDYARFLLDLLILTRVLQSFDAWKMVLVCLFMDILHQLLEIVDLLLGFISYSLFTFLLQALGIVWLFFINSSS